MQLLSERLGVEIAVPGEMYRGSRFDWSGFVTQVTLDQRHTFCVPESHDPNIGCGGYGLSNEFGIEAPIGYGDAKVGEQFPKLGIGLLRKPDEAPYQFATPYEVTPFPIDIDAGANTVTFTVQPLPCRGYAAKLAKTFTVDQNTLTIAYDLENVGEHTIRTTEYCHNFISVDDLLVGPDFALRFSFPLRIERVPELLEVSGDTIRWRGIAAKDHYCRPHGYASEPSFWWSLTHEPSGVGVREQGDFPLAYVAVWGRAHVVSPETFVAIDLAPGVRQRWTRRYEFFAR